MTRRPASIDAQIAEWKAKGLGIAEGPMTEPLSQKQYASAVLPKKPKYGNKKVELGGKVFDSKKEAADWLELLERERRGEITELEWQPVFKCVVNGKLVCKYVADAAYMLDGERVVQDTKSAITKRNRAYRIKKKLVEALFGIVIVEK